jgi:16S rRNA (guanine966-N2)-methyltransferase
MRVVGGTESGRRLRAPAGRRVRPTSDRVREAVFDVLGSLGGVEGARVADLFAGTGALGVEALSRGARHVTFVERDPGVLESLRSNTSALGLGDRCEVVRADVLAWLEGRAAEHGTGFDLALCDPPYSFVRWPRLLASLDAPLAVLEASDGVPAAVGWDVLKVKRYGGTVVTLMRKLPRASSEVRS